MTILQTWYLGFLWGYFPIWWSVNLIWWMFSITFFLKISQNFFWVLTRFSFTSNISSSFSFSGSCMLNEDLPNIRWNEDAYSEWWTLAFINNIAAGTTRCQSLVDLQLSNASFSIVSWIVLLCHSMRPFPLWKWETINLYSISPNLQTYFTNLLVYSLP